MRRTWPAGGRSRSRWPVAASASHSDGGVRKLVTVEQRLVADAARVRDADRSNWREGRAPSASSCRSARGGTARCGPAHCRGSRRAARPSTRSRPAAPRARPAVDQRRMQMRGIGAKLREIDRQQRPGREACLPPAGVHSSCDWMIARPPIRSTSRALAGIATGRTPLGPSSKVLAWKKSVASTTSGSVRFCESRSTAARRRHVRRHAAEQLDRRSQRLAALQPLDDISIARLGQLPGLPFARDQQAVGVLPRDVLLALGQDEAALDESLSLQVELADRDRVLAAVRQVDQAAPLERPGALRALPHPIGFLGRGQRIEVEHRLPLRACRWRSSPASRAARCRARDRRPARNCRSGRR